MRAAIPAFAIALLVAACDNQGSQQATPNQPVQTIKVTSAAQQQLHKASDLDRAIGLKRAIYDSGYSCRRVTSSGFSGTYKNLDMWVARCSEGRDWAVFIGPDGSAQVRDCKDVASVGLPECKIAAEDKAGGKTG